MISAQLTAAGAAGQIWRVGFRPEPWAWSGRGGLPTGDSRGRWDDPHGNFRTIYAGSSLVACLREVLARFRKDARLSMELDEIVEDDEDGILHPTIAPGRVTREWLEVRAAASAKLWAIFERPGNTPITPNIHDVVGDEPTSPPVTAARRRPCCAGKIPNSAASPPTSSSTLPNTPEKFTPSAGGL